MDNDEGPGLRMLTAFCGAAIGSIGCLAGALKADVTFTAITATGTAICFCIWFQHLKVFE